MKTPMIIWQGEVWLGKEDREFRFVTKDKDSCYPLDLILEECLVDALGNISWQEVKDDFTRIWVMSVYILRNYES